MVEFAGAFLKCRGWIGAADADRAVGCPGASVRNCPNKACSQLRHTAQNADGRRSIPVLRPTGATTAANPMKEWDTASPTSPWWPLGLPAPLPTALAGDLSSTFPSTGGQRCPDSPPRRGPANGHRMTSFGGVGGTSGSGARVSGQKVCCAAATIASAAASMKPGYGIPRPIT